MTGGSYEIFLFTRSFCGSSEEEERKENFQFEQHEMHDAYLCLFGLKLKFRTVFIMIVEIASFCVFHVIVQQNALCYDNIADGDSRILKRWVDMKK